MRLTISVDPTRFWIAVVAIAVAIFLLFAPLTASAQSQPPKRGIGGFPLLERPLPEKPPRPPVGPASIHAFVESVGSPQADASLELVLGRPRIVTLKKPLGEGGDRARVDVGEPAFVDVLILSPTQIRLRGRRPGVTDVTLTTGGGESLVLRATVVYDLDILRAQLGQTFPDASLYLRQIRDHVVISGQARDAAQVGRILQLVRAYLQSAGAEVRTNQQF